MNPDLYAVLELNPSTGRPVEDTLVLYSSKAAAFDMTHVGNRAAGREIYRVYRLEAVGEDT